MLQRRAVFTRFNAVTGRLDANQAHAGVVDKVCEHTDGVGAAADAGDHRIREATLFFEDLRFGLFTDHALEFAHDSRERVRASRGTEHIVCGFIAARPVAQRFVTGVFQRRGAAVHRDHFCSHQTHTEDVRRLTLNVFCSHIDAAFQTEQGAGKRRGHAVLTRTGFGDDFGFAHTLRKQRLTQHLVSFMRAAVQQVFTLQIQRGFGAFRQVAAFGQRGRTTGVIFQQVGKFSLKRRVFLRADKRFFQLAQRGHQDLRDVHPAELTKIRVK